MRKWLPGEKEAEALQRVGDVKNAQQREILDHQHKQRKELIAMDAIIKMPPKSSIPAVRSPFATNTTDTGVSVNKRGSVKIVPSAPRATDEQPELFNRMKEIDPRIIDSRDTLNGKELQEPFDNAMAMALKVISGAGTSMDADLMSPGAPGGSGKLGLMFDSIAAQRGGGAPAVQPSDADDIAGVYESGGSIFGEQSDGGGTAPSLSWLRSPDTEIAAGGGDAVASEAYASSVGGMIDAFMRRNYNV